MRDADQELRKAYGKAKKGGEEFQALEADLARLDSEHYIKLQAFADSSLAYPHPSIYGDEASHAFWVLIIHQDDHVELQELVLTWMQEMKKKKPYQKRDLATLSDRVAVNKGECQTYGTQFDWIASIRTYKAFSICNEKKLEKLRKKMKLMPFEKQVKQENK